MGFVKKYSLEIFFIVAFLALAIKVNLQFLEAANINLLISGHDEYLTIKEVNAILHPISGKHFLLSLISGDVLFYGRVIFYTDAVVAFLPDRIWGITGMVFAIRMFHATLLVLGLSLLSSVFLKDRLAKVLFFLSALTVAHTFYFTMMPKPEPHQLFLFALFLFYFKKKNWEFGRHFIWLGLAFGAKFNLLLVLPLVFIVPLLWKGSLEIKPNIKKGIWAFVYFLIGFFIAVPCLLVSPVKPIYLKTYINANLKNTTKVYDDPNIGLMDWLGTGLGDTYFGWKISGLVFVGLLLLAAVYLLMKYKRDKNFESLLLISIGLILMLIIAIKVKRLWPHYLWTGYIFASLGFIHLVFSQVNKKLKYALLVVCSFFILSTTLKFVSTNYERYTTVDQKEDVKQKREEGLKVIKYIKTNYPKGTTVATDGTLYYPFTEFIKANPYHPFDSKLPSLNETKFQWYLSNLENIWNKQNDVVVFYSRQPLSFETETRQAFPDKYDVIKKTFLEQINSDFKLDTVIGRAEIYQRTVAN